MKMFTLKIIVASMLTMVSTASTAFDDATPNADIIKTQSEQIILLDEVRKRELAWEVAPVKSAKQLKVFMKNESPLDLLSPAAKKRFIDSLVFREKGLGGMYIGDLELELTPTEIYHLLSLFGAQHVTQSLTNARVETKLDKMLLEKAINSKMPNYKNYECIKRGTCKYSVDRVICMSTC